MTLPTSSTSPAKHACIQPGTRGHYGGVLERAGIAAVVLVAAACSFQGGIDPGFQCGEDGWCPSGQQCVGGFCTRDPAAADAGPDADPNAPDAGPPAARCGTLSVLRDEFDDATPWPQFYSWQDTGVSISETGGHVVVDVPAGTAPGWAGYTTMHRYDLTGGAWEVKVSESGGHFTTIEVRAHTGARAQLLNEDGTLLAAVYNVPDDGVRASRAYDPVDDLYWRIREDGGVLYWETSPDRAAWSELHSEPVPIPTEHVMGLVSGGGQLRGAASQLRFDDVNFASGDEHRYCPGSDLVDDFVGTSLDPQWEYWEDPDCTTTVANGNLVFTFPYGVGSVWCGVGSRHLYDLRDSAVVLDTGGMVAGANNFITYFQAMEIGDDNTHLEIARDDDSVLSMDHLVGDVSMAGTTRSYNELDHRFWRLRGAGGRVFFETSPDNATWTTHVEDTARFDLSRVAIVIGAGHYLSGPSAPVTTQLFGIND